ncbi:alpha/beta fold hydrolase [Streptomyces sp. NPDC018031]|uniref:alpha/beta fold hydrolase n=1 Tax=Streptomyces sp. NPDC018031 TaxID=3365033 RepID=UPI0037965277
MTSHTTVPSVPPVSSLGRVVRGAGPGLLLAHGAGGGIDPNYGPLMDGLAAHHTVVGPDFPGTGRTPRATSPLSLDGLADALVATAVEEGLETFAVSGYSLGGPVAVRAATRHPDRVTALVLTASFAAPNPRLRLAVRLWRDLLDSGDAGRLAAFGLLVGMGAPTLDGLGADDVDAALRGAAAGVPAGTADHLDLIDAVDVRDDLPRLTVPTLVVSTTQDSLVTPALHRELADAIPGARLTGLASGHLPFAERPAEWLEIILGFLAAAGRVPAGAAGRGLAP